MSLWLWISCGDPPACDRLCDAAVDLQAACLDADGLAWTAIGETGASGFRDACATWVWSQRLLLRDAGAPPGALQDSCAARRQALADPSSTCQDLATMW